MSSKSALVLVEYQREWLSPDGKLQFLLKDRQQFDNSIASSLEAIGVARDAGMLVAHVGLHFSDDHRELGGKGAAKYGLREAIPRVGTFRIGEGGDSHVAPFIATGPNEIEIKGRTGASAFTGSNLNAYLRNHGVTHIYLMGYALHVCILATLIDAHEHGYDTTLLADCCSAFTPEQRKYTLEDVVHHFGEHISNETFSKRVKAAA